MPRGYDRALCVLPFDHRAFSQSGLQAVTRIAGCYRELVDRFEED